jgi:hypothetical protein
MLLVGALVATACGAGTSSTSPTSSTVEAYQALGQKMADTVTAYHSETGSMPDPEACQAAFETYQAEMAQHVTHMQELSTEMDSRMGEHHAEAADMTCVANAMSAELERHAGAACATHDLEADRAEAADHVATMTMEMEHQRIRYEDAASTMGMMSPTPESTWTCHQNADGTFTMGDHTWTPGEGTCPGPAPTEPTPTPWPPCGCHDGHC